MTREDPEELWKWMNAYEQKTGGRLLAIPHNGNLSCGMMFDDVTLTTKKPLDRDYALRRMRWEPIYEVTQMKGDGEAHPVLSPRMSSPISKPGTRAASARPSTHRTCCRASMRARHSSAA